MKDIGIKRLDSNAPQQQQAMLCNAICAAGKRFDDGLLYRVQVYEHQATLVLD